MPKIVPVRNQPVLPPIEKFVVEFTYAELEKLAHSAYRHSNDFADGVGGVVFPIVEKARQELNIQSPPFRKF